MSIRLRQECQPSLDKIGLSKYHARIEYPNHGLRSLEIVGECGKMLTEVKGIEFVNLNPTIKEIKYTVELLEAFLVKYALLIKKFLQLSSVQIINPSKIVDKYSEPLYKFGIHDTGTSNKIYKKEAVVYTDKIIKLAYFDDRLHFFYAKTHPLEDLTTFTYDKQLLKKAKDALKLHLKFLDHKEKIKKIKDELNTCSI